MEEKKRKKIDLSPKIAVKQLPPIKLKDKMGRNRIVLKMKEVFGFIPETLVIDKIRGENNKILISAVEEKNNGKNR